MLSRLQMQLQAKTSTCGGSEMLCHAVYRGVAYDLTAFIDNHPAGSWLINLSLGRDCTALFESYHLRPAVAVARLKTLPTIPDFPVAAVPEAPRPNDSDLYNTIRERVRTEVFKGEVWPHCHPHRQRVWMCMVDAIAGVHEGLLLPLSFKYDYFWCITHTE